MDWAAALVREGNFRESADAHFVAAYLGIPRIRLQIIECLRERGSVTRPTIAEVLGWTTGGLRPHLEVLEDLGLIEPERIRTSTSCKPVTAYRLNEMRLRALADSVAEALYGLPTTVPAAAHA